MTLKSEAKFEEKLTSGLVNNMRILAPESTRALESLKNWDFDEILLSKVENVCA